MKKNIFLLFLIIYSIGAYSQTSSSNTNYNTNNNKKDVGIFKKYNNSLVDKYLSNNWQGGSIFLDDQTVLLGFVFKYNIVTDEIEVKATINPSSVEYISIGGKIFLHSEYENEHGELDKGYFEVLVKGDCKLLIKRIIVTEPINNIDVMVGKSKRPSEVEELFYIKNGDQVAVMIKKKEDLIEKLSDKEDFVEYINDKFVPLLNKRNLTKFIDYYNHL